LTKNGNCNQAKRLHYMSSVVRDKSLTNYFEVNDFIT
jgi:hypothetical protein